MLVFPEKNKDTMVWGEFGYDRIIFNIKSAKVVEVLPAAQWLDGAGDAKHQRIFADKMKVLRGLDGWNTAATAAEQRLGLKLVLPDPLGTKRRSAAERKRKRSQASGSGNSRGDDGGSGDSGGNAATANTSEVSGAAAAPSVAAGWVRPLLLPLCRHVPSCCQQANRCMRATHAHCCTLFPRCSVAGSGTRRPHWRQPGSRCAASRSLVAPLRTSRHVRWGGEGGGV